MEAALTDEALRSAVDAAPDGIVIVDEAGLIVFANPMAERLFGYARDELVGSSVDRLLPTAAQPTHACLPGRVHRPAASRGRWVPASRCAAGNDRVSSFRSRSASAHSVATIARS